MPTRALAEFVANLRFEDLPPAVVAQACDIIVDAVGCALSAWVEDKDKYPVRTLALWFKGERWLPDLRAWHHSDQLRALAEGSDITTSVSSATRSPGKYTLKWDGKDNGGKLVKAGKYTVYIEAAREHGTYQLMKQEIDFSASRGAIEVGLGAGRCGGNHRFDHESFPAGASNGMAENVIHAG